LYIFYQMIKAYPKIFAIGQDYISAIFEDEVEITEKIDGSQFDFGKINGEMHFRSKGKPIYEDAPEKMFIQAIDYASSIENKIPDNTVFYCEYIKDPKHNVLKYNRIPKNYLMLFAISTTGDKFVSEHKELQKFAELIDIETVPLLYQGKVKNIEEMTNLLEKESVLGGTLIEGFVVKNYKKPFLLGGQPIPVMAGKFVSEKFKETHKTSWGKDFTAKGKFETFCESFATQARWQKGVQHLKEKGLLTNSPKDIGMLMKEIQTDVAEEEKANIQKFLWKEFGEQVLRKSIKGFPEWYKEQLLQKGVEKEKN